MRQNINAQDFGGKSCKNETAWETQEHKGNNIKMGSEEIGLDGSVGPFGSGHRWGTAFL